MEFGCLLLILTFWLYFVPKLNTSLCGSWDTMLFVDTVGTTAKQVAIVWACFAKKTVIGYAI